MLLSSGSALLLSNSQIKMGNGHLFAHITAPCLGSWFILDSVQPFNSASQNCLSPQLDSWAEWSGTGPNWLVAMLKLLLCGSLIEMGIIGSPWMRTQTHTHRYRQLCALKRSWDFNCQGDACILFFHRECFYVKTLTSVSAVSRHTHDAHKAVVIRRLNRN